ncbi:MULTISPECIES: hypothetical protein [Kitasatospora]|uniref:Uncharacterized protein n=1 Tax=Kitasatospora setae (strain ATCC 33774 / DSM 43861 / JCM 3304 / KCC A-0304 / NBRC 14216 / KM-6054) TaxID=452652 RepID=E4N8T5_KITSK|nr:MULTISPECIES: hypothetical protein [Kitasatospora]BAJ27616.1 hypothetical protein KSE_17915 [Kitasatospora setae KM-6054]
MTAETRLDWFSCRVRFACYASGDGVLLHMLSTYLLRAADFDDAWRRALLRARAEERVQPNGVGGTARTALVRVESVDRLAELADGTEVSCVWTDDVRPCPYPLDHVFRPEQSRPGRSL